MSTLPPPNYTSPEHIRFALQMIASISIGSKWPGTDSFSTMSDWLIERAKFFDQVDARADVAEVVVGELGLITSDLAGEVREAVKRALRIYDLKVASE